MSTPVNISGSRGAAILGLSKWSTPVNIWLQIQEYLHPGFCTFHNYTLPVFEGNAATRFGNAFENEILKLTEKKFGSKILSRQKFFQKDYLSCHPDGIMSDTLIEVKTTTEFSYRNEWDEDTESGKIPIDYQIQVNHNSYLCKLNKILMPVLIFPNRQDKYEELGIGKDSDFSMIKISEWVRVLDQMGCLKYYTLTPNHGLQKLMLEKYSEFWNVNVIGEKEPEPRTYDDIRALCPSPAGTILTDLVYTCPDCKNTWRSKENQESCLKCKSSKIESYDEIAGLVSERLNIKEEIGDGGQLAKRAEMIKVQVLDYMRKAGAVIDDESKNKFLLMSRDGHKLATYGKNKNGVLYFK